MAPESSPLSSHAASVPLVGVSTNVRQLPDFRVHGATERSLQAVYDVAGCLPLMLPALGNRYDFAQIVERLDGLLLTGGASHVDPAEYSGDEDLDPAHKDKARDATTLPLIRMAIEAGLPVLAICRGIQELNVALGGTLAEVADKTVHSSDKRGDRPLEDWLENHSHTIRVEAGGLLAGIWPGVATTQINSAHSQRIASLSPRLRVEAVADDGVIEAVSVNGAAAFALGVQWHPEYMGGAQAEQLFRAFGQAARSRFSRRLLQSAWADSVIDEKLPDAGGHA